MDHAPMDMILRDLEYSGPLVDCSAMVRSFVPQDSHVTAPAATIPTTADIDAAVAKLSGLHIPQVGPHPKLRERRVGKYLYIPIDVAEIELPHRARIAVDAAGAGFQVVIGSGANIFRYGGGDLPPGIVLVNSLTGESAKRIFKMACAGHITIAMDETADRYVDKNAASLVDYRMPDCEPRFKPYKRSLIKSDIIVLGCAPNLNARGELSENLKARAIESGAPFDKDALRDDMHEELSTLDAMLQAYRDLYARFGERVKYKPHPLEWTPRYGIAGISPQGYWLPELLKGAQIIVCSDSDPRWPYLYACGYPLVHIEDGGDVVDRVEKSTSVLIDRIEHSSQPAVTPLKSTALELITRAHREHAYDMPFIVAKAWSSQRAEPYAYTPVDEARFPVIPEGKLLGLFDCSLNQLEARVWLLGVE